MTWARRARAMCHASLSSTRPPNRRHDVSHVFPSHSPCDNPRHIAAYAPRPAVAVASAGLRLSVGDTAMPQRLSWTSKPRTFSRGAVVMRSCLPKRTTGAGKSPRRAKSQAAARPKPSNRPAVGTSSTDGRARISSRVSETATSRVPTTCLGRARLMPQPLLLLRSCSSLR